ncbi:MAG: SH3 domain-containing protein [Clostridiales Family XIII bacterium]|jgi:hypothetical protein|nr:SH3 domain-containing protein [Clostridiales Family XIII bacterium]
MALTAKEAEKRAAAPDTAAPVPPGHAVPAAKRKLPLVPLVAVGGAVLALALAALLIFMPMGFHKNPSLPSGSSALVGVWDAPEAIYANEQAEASSSSQGNAAEEAAAAEEDAAEEDLYFVTNYDDYGIFVRSTPSATTNVNKILYIEAGDRNVILHWLGLTEYHEGYNWYHVQIPDGRTGWVRDDVVRVRSGDACY